MELNHRLDPITQKTTWMTSHPNNKRLLNIALPWLTLNSRLNQASTLGMGFMNAGDQASRLKAIYKQIGLSKDLFDPLVQLTLCISQVSLTALGSRYLPFAQIASHSYQFLVHTKDGFCHLKDGEIQAFITQDAGHMLSSSLYIASKIYGGHLLLGLSLGTQAATNFIHAITIIRKNDLDALDVLEIISNIALGTLNATKAADHAKSYFETKHVFVITTLNAGRSWDYRNLLEAYENDPNVSEEAKEYIRELLEGNRCDPSIEEPKIMSVHEKSITNEFRAKRDELGQKLIAELAPKSDIFCLQEMSPTKYEMEQNGWKTDRMFNIWFEGQEFDKVLSSKGEGVAWDKNRFDLIEGSVRTNLGTETTGNVRWLSVDLNDKTTGKTVRVASGHFTGFSIDDMANNEAQALEDAQKSLSMTDKLITSLTTAPCDYTFVGADTNADPRVYNGHQDAFTDHNFTYDKSLNDTPTNYFSDISDYVTRKLDFIYGRSEKDSELTIENIPNSAKLYDPRYPSDHLPLTYRYTYKDNTSSLAASAA